MSQAATPAKGGEWKAFLWPSLLLASALAMALASSVARRDGQPYASALLALIALLSAAVSSLVLVPKLLSRLRLEFLNHFRFFRFTSRGVIFVVLVLVVAFASLNTGNNLLILVLSVLLSALIVSGAVSNLVLHGLKISLGLPETIHAGQRSVFTLTLCNLKRFVPSFALRLNGRYEGAGQGEGEQGLFVQETLFPYIRAGGEMSARVEALFHRRGVYPLTGFEVRTQFPFGFFARGRSLAARGNIVVYPALVEIAGLLRSYPALTGSIERRRKGTGSGLYNIRPYRGDEGTRFVHWKSTAKLSQLMVKDFVAEDDTPYHIVLSTYLPSPGSAAREQFEKAISCVASLGHHYRRAGCPFCFSTEDFEVLVKSSAREYEMFMEYLSLVTPREKPRSTGPRAGANSIMFAAGSTVSLEGAPVIDYLKL